GLREHYANDREGADRLENLQELVNAATVFAAEENFDGWPAGRIEGMDRVAGDRVASTRAASDGVASDDGASDGAATDAAAEGTLAVDDPAEGVTNMSPLAAFLTHASLEAGDNQAQAGQDAVQLMTVHAAKGLEFD